MHQNRALPFASAFSPKTQVLQEISAVRISFAHFNRRGNGRSLTIFDRKEIAHTPSTVIITILNLIPKFWCIKKCGVISFVPWPKSWCNICNLHLSPQALPFSKLWPSDRVVPSAGLSCY